MFKSIIGLLMALILSACAGTMPALDSNEDRLAAAEISFQETVKLAVKLHPRLSEDRKVDVRDAITCLHSYLVAARAALTLKDDIDFSSNLKALQSGMTILRPILLQMEENGDVDSFEFNCIA